MIESVTNFFQAFFEQRKLDGMIKRQEADRIRKRLLWEASEKLHGRIRDVSDGRRSQRVRRELALCNDQRRYVDEREIAAVVVASTTIVITTTVGLPTGR